MSDAQVYRKQGFGRSLGVVGRPGLLLVDFVNGFADPGIFGGGNIPAAIMASAPVLEYFRAHGHPVAHSRIVFAEDGSDAGIFALKVPGLLRLTETSPDSATVASLSPRPGELVVRKTEPSAFFGTGLAAWLASKAVQTLVIVGCTTSGCVRASVVDAMSSGFRPIVPADCVGDRALGPHEANLFDIGQKYGDVVTSAELLASVSGQRSAGA